MNAEFFEALAMLEKERGLPADYLLEKIKNAIVIAVKKDYEVEDENVSVVIEPDQGKFSVSLLKTVVEEVEDPATEISLEEAQQKKKSCKAGDEYAIPLKTKDFGRIAAQTAKHVIRQGLKEAERSQMYAEMQSKAHEIISAVVTNIEPVKYASLGVCVNFAEVSEFHAALYGAKEVAVHSIDISTLYRQGFAKFVQGVLTRTPPEPYGTLLRPVQILNALVEAAQTGREAFVAPPLE